MQQPFHCYLWVLLFFFLHVSLAQSQDWDPLISRMSQNSQYSVETEPDYEKKFDILTVTPGKWYFWVETCGLSLNLTIESEDEDAKIMTIPKGGSYLYKDTIENKPIEAHEDRPKSVNIRALHEDRDQKGRIYIYTAVINELEFANYELKKEPRWMKVSYKYEPYNSEVIIKFNPLKFQSDTQSADKIKYQVTLFQAQDFFDKEIYCETGLQASGVSSSEIEVPIGYKEQIVVRLFEVWDGKYHVKVKAFVIHESEIIRFYTYTNGYVNVRKPIFLNIFVVFVGGVVLVLVVIMCKGCYKKVGAWDLLQADEGEDVEKRKRKKEKKWYEALEDEKEGEEEGGNENNIQEDFQ